MTFGITVCHHSACLLISNVDPQDRYLYPTLTLMMDSYIIIWASSQQNLSSGFPTKRDSYQSSQPQRLARKLKFYS